MWKEIIENTEAALFDLDGTVIDSMWIWKNIDEEYFERCQIDLPPDYQKQIEGLSFYETAVYTHDHYIPWLSIQKLMDDWNEMAYEHYSNIVKPKDFIGDLLEYLKKKNIKLGIATSNSRILCHATLKNNGLFEYFDSIITGEVKGAGKPFPDVYINSARAIGVTCDKCLVFEDVVNGIIAGKDAGMRTVAVHDDYSAYQWDEKCRIADYNIMSYKEILDEVSDTLS